MMSSKLPAVLQVPLPNSSISIERTLKQIQELLEQYPAVDAPTEDRIQASLGDIATMIRAIER